MKISACCPQHQPKRAPALRPLTPSSGDSVALGVMDMRPVGPANPSQIAFNSEQAALWSVDAAVQAASQGTFGVGGALLGPHRELLAISCNRVVADGKVADPTAHGERQLVDWYFEKKAAGQSLPAAQDCTIVSSLDPCMMCAGSILSGGFKVASTTLDTTAGVNFNTLGDYPTLPAGLRETARQNFAYFGVEGKREYQGPAVLGERAVLPVALEDRSINVFLNSLKAVRETIHAGGDVATIDPLQCEDPALLTSLKAHSPAALSLRFPAGQPGPELATSLLQAAAQSEANGGKFNAAALLDPHGNLLLVCSGREGESPIRTPFMELTRQWAHIRAESPEPAQKYLAHLKDCTVVTLLGPGQDAASVAELGAYGSSVEGPMPATPQAAWQYILPRQSQTQLDQEIQALPPLYSQIIQPRIQQVSDQALVHLCTHHDD